MTDEEIIRQILAGNKDLYRLIVEKYQQLVFRTCMGFIHSKEDADDLTQEIFINTYRALQGFKGNSSFTTWIYRITVNASLNRKRKTSGNLFRRLGFSHIDDEKRIPGIPADENENPETILIRNEHREWVQKALDSLPENQRTAIILSKYDDLSQKEIAEIMNISEGAVEALIQRAKANLRKKLSPLLKKK